MSTITRRKKTAKSVKDDLKPRALSNAKSIPRSSPFFERPRTWLIVISLLTLVALYHFYPLIRDLFHQEHAEVNSGDVLVKRKSLEPFMVVDLPGKGKGMIAIRDIEQGERIITEKPALIAPTQGTGSPSVLIAKLLQEADARDREAVLNLSYVNFPENLDPEKHPNEVALAIFQTNAVTTSRGVGIFPRMARMNHGCSGAFNAVYSWRDQEGVLVVHALKKISKGEEILTTYTNTKRARAERRAYLQQNYGFTCMCRVCSLPDNESLASDKRLAQISDGYARLATWGQGKINGVEALETVQLIWSLEDEEEYWSERGQLAADAAWVAAAYSDSTATIEWAHQAIVWYGYELGTDSDQVRAMEQIVRDPQGHSGWGSREHRGRSEGS